MPSNKIQSLYFVLPIPLQNILVSLKGLSLRLRRNRKQYRISRQAISSRDEVWEGEDFKNFQNMQLWYLLEHAYNNVPFYKEFYDKHSVNVASIKSVEDLGRLPVLEKETIKKKNASFFAKSQKKAKSHTIHTTGTTGTPLAIYTCSKERQLNYAFFDNWLSSLGLNPHKRHIIIGGRIVVDQKQKNPPFWRYSFFQNSLLFSSYHISEANCAAYIDRINRYQPEYIESYPSSISLLAMMALKQDLEVFSPKAIITSAETLFDEQREMIERVFQCNVYDQYGAAEMCAFIAQCKNGNYHTRPDYAIIEFIGAGPYKEVICTSLINYTMPLIRYRIGDSVLLSREECSCGLNTQTVKKIVGRMDDFVYTSTGQAIGRLSPVLKGLPIIEAQYVQREIGHLEVHIVKASDYTEDTQRKVISELRKRVGENMELQIVYRDQIDRGSGPKLKSVINLSSNKFE